MLRTALLIFCLLPFWANAEIITCEQQQTLCESQCRFTSLGDEKKLETCKARCLGKRVSCSLEKGASTVKEAWNNSSGLPKELGEKTKAFWEGLNE